MYEDIGSRIKQAREQAGYTQRELAKKIGKSQQTVNKYENGDCGGIPLPLVKAIATATGVTAAWLVGWEKKEEEEKITSRAKEMTAEEQRQVLQYMEFVISQRGSK